MITAIVIDAPGDQHADEVAVWSGATDRQLPQLSHAEHRGARLTPSLVLLVQELGSERPRSMVTATGW